MANKGKGKLEEEEVEVARKKKYPDLEFAANPKCFAGLPFRNTHRMRCGHSDKGLIQENELDSELDFTIEKHTWHSLDFLNDLKDNDIINLEASTGVKVGILDLGRSINQQLTGDQFNAFSKGTSLEVKHNCTNHATMGWHGYYCGSILTGIFRDVDFFDHVPEGKQIRGVIPSADLHMYAFGCDNCFKHRKIVFDSAVEVMNKVVDDQIRILSASIKVPSIKYDHKSLDLFKANVLMVNSAGNNGSSGKILHGMPWSLTVGACSFEKTLRVAVEIGTYEVVPPDIKTLKTVVDDKGKVINILSEFEGFALNILEIGFRELKHSKNMKGPANAILRYRSGSSEFFMLETLPSLYFKDNLNIKSTIEVGIDEKQCREILSLISNFGSLHVRVSKSKYCDDESDFHVCDFSSRGPSRNYPEIIKPDLIAPGHAILASHPTDLPIVKSTAAWNAAYSSQYIGSGTSASTPHVAGLATILCSLRPSWGPSVIKSALVTTARRDPKLKGNAFSIGAGTVQLEKALHPGLVYEEQYDNFLKYFREKRPSDAYNLNLPSFAARLTSLIRKEVVFNRELKDVEGRDETMTYEAKIEYYDKSLDNEVEIVVEPTTLNFEAGERKKFQMTVTVYPRNIKGCIDAYLTWKCRDRQVVSPILLYYEEPKQ